MSKKKNNFCNDEGSGNVFICKIYKICKSASKEFLTWSGILSHNSVAIFVNFY